MTGIAAIIFVAGVAAAFPSPEPSLSWVGFSFRPPATGEQPSGERTEVVFETPAATSVTEIAVFEEAAGPGPRWRLLGSASGARMPLAGSPNSIALALYRLRGERLYLMDGPFPWPARPGRREPSPIRRRTIGGVVHGAPASPAPRLLPDAGGAFCGVEPLGVWSCTGVRSDARGVVVGAGADANEDRRRVFWADVPAVGAAPGAVETRTATWIAFLRLAADPPPPGPPSPSLRKPGPGGGVLLVPDPAFETRFVAPDLLLLFGREPPKGRTAGFRWSPLSAHADLESLVSPGLPAEPILLPMRAPITVRGTVRGPEGDPIPGAPFLLFERREPRAGEVKTSERVVDGGETDHLGRFEIADVAATRHRLRACDGSLGCAEKDVALDAPENDVVILPKTAFRGRVVSRGGVPEPGAWIRISPAASEYIESADPIRLLPLVARADAEGRFRIAAPATGRFVLEAKSERGGAARREVEVGELTPRVTDVGDLVLSVPGTFDAIVKGCPGGELTLTGPMGGESMLPTSVRFPLDPAGRGRVELPEGGAWIAAATCGSTRRFLEPTLLNEVRDVFGSEVVFELAPDGAPR